MTYTLIALNIVMCITIALFTCRIINTTCAIAENRFDTNLHIITRVIGKVLQVGVIISAALFLCKVFNVDTTNFLAALGIGGFAFALAGKDTLENFLGSIAIIVDRPFITGDVVKIGNIEGSIQQVGVRSTKILTFENSVITLPNRTFISSSVDNRQLRKWRRYKTTFDILLTTEGSKVEAFTKGVTELIQLLPDSINAQTQVYLYELGTSSLQVYIRVFFVNKGRDAELKFRQELNLQILELAKNLEIRFAFPTQTLHINNEDTTNGNHSSKVVKKEPEENESGYSAGILLARKISPYYDPDK